jgi:hypothetical protein
MVATPGPREIAWVLHQVSLLLSDSTQEWAYSPEDTVGKQRWALPWEREIVSKPL